MNAKLLIFGGEGLREWGRVGHWVFKGERVPGASLSRSGLEAPPTEGFPSFGWGRRDGEVFAILRRLLAPHHGGYPQTLLFGPGRAALQPFRNNPARFLKALLQTDNAAALAPSRLDELLDTPALQAFLAGLAEPAEPALPTEPDLTEWLLASILERPAEPWLLRRQGTGLDQLNRLIPALDGLPSSLQSRASWLIGAPASLGDEYGVRLVLQGAAAEASPQTPPGPTGRLALAFIRSIQPTWLWSGDPAAAVVEPAVEGLLRILARGTDQGGTTLLDQVRGLPDRDHPEVAALERLIAAHQPRAAGAMLQDHSPEQIGNDWRRLVDPETWIGFWSAHTEEADSLTFPDWEVIWERKLALAPAERVPSLVARMLDRHPGVPDWLWNRDLLRLTAAPHLWREGAGLLPHQAIKSLVRASMQAQDEGLGIQFRLLLGREADWDDLPLAVAEQRCGHLLTLVAEAEVSFSALAVGQLDRLAGALVREALPLGLKRQIAAVAGGAWEPFRSLWAAMEGRLGSDLLEEPSLEESRRLVQELEDWPGQAGEAPDLPALENLLGAFAGDALGRLVLARSACWGLSSPGPCLDTLFRYGAEELPRRFLRQALREADALAQLPHLFAHLTAGLLPRSLVLQEAEVLAGEGAPAGCVLLAVLAGWPQAAVICGAAQGEVCRQAVAAAADQASPLAAWARPLLEAAGPVPFAEFVSSELKADLLAVAPSWQPLATLERLADGSWTDADRQTELPLPVDFLRDWAHRSWSPQSRPLVGPPCLERLAGLWVPAQIAALPPPPVDLQRFPPWLRGLRSAGLRERFEADLGRYLETLADSQHQDLGPLSGDLLPEAQSLFQRCLGTEHRWLRLLPCFGPFEGWERALQSPEHLAGLGLLAAVNTVATEAWLEVLASSALRRRLAPECLSAFAAVHPAWQNWDLLQKSLAGGAVTAAYTPYPGELTRLLKLIEVPIQVLPPWADDSPDPEDRQAIRLLRWLLDGDPASALPEGLEANFLQEVLSALLQRLSGLAPGLGLEKYTQLLVEVVGRSGPEALADAWAPMVAGARLLGPQAGWRCLLVHPAPSQAAALLRQSGGPLPGAALLRIRVHRLLARSLLLAPTTPRFWRLLATLGPGRSAPGRD